MKKLNRIILWAGTGFLLMVFFGAIVVGLFFGRIVKAAIETIGPKFTQTAIKLDTVDLSLLSGSVKLKGLVVGNPAGYRTSNALSIGDAAVDIKPMSVFSNRVIVKSLKIEALEVIIEGNPLGQNNLKKILDNVNAAVASPQASKTSGRPGKKYDIGELIITDAKVQIGSGTTIPMSKIELHNLGKGAEGVTSAELAKIVLGEVLKETLKTAGGAAVNAGKTAGERINAIKKGISNLFGK
jgi:uncharacterized protein involved in outer membrane biogenesis